MNRVLILFGALFILSLAGCNHESPLSKCLKGCNINFKSCLTIPLEQRDQCWDTAGSCYETCSKINS